MAAPETVETQIQFEAQAYEPHSEVCLTASEQESITTSPQAQLQAFYENYHPVLLGFATRLAGNRHDAEDLVQDAYMRALNHLNDGGSVDFPHSWLGTIVRNRNTDRFRRAEHRRAVTFSDPQDYDRFFNGEFEESVGSLHGSAGCSEDDLLDKLVVSDVITEIVDTFGAETTSGAVAMTRLRHILLAAMGYQMTEISVMDNIPLGTVKSGVYRLLPQIRQLGLIQASAE